MNTNPSNFMNVEITPLLLLELHHDDPYPLREQR
jgi:hypothetical protein